MTWLLGLDVKHVAGGQVDPATSAPNCIRDRMFPLLKTAVVPDAVTVDVAPAVPTPPKIAGCQLIVCVAVNVDPCVALKVNVVVVGDVCTKVPVIVPDVNGVVRFVGDEMLSVFVMFALTGVTE